MATTAWLRPGPTVGDAPIIHADATRTSNGQQRDLRIQGASDAATWSPVDNGALLLNFLLQAPGEQAEIPASLAKRLGMGLGREHPRQSCPPASDSTLCKKPRLSVREASPRRSKPLSTGLALAGFS